MPDHIQSFIKGREMQVLNVSFGGVNWVVLIVYLLGIILLGYYFSRRASKNLDEYFRGGKRVPGWAAGVSIWATTLSSITFMAIPAKAFTDNWLFAFDNYTIVLITPFIIIFFLPFFRKLNITSAYEYLEARFDLAIRLIGSLGFCFFHIFRIAIVIYLPTLAITSVTNLNPYMIVILIGFLCVLYTCIGGMEGVVWSDTIQGIILLLGAVISIGVAIYNIDGGFSAVFTTAAEHGKFIPKGAWDWSFINATIPVIVLGGLFNNLYQYVGSQDVVQRYNTTPTARLAAKALKTNAIFSCFDPIIFYGFGTVLFVFYTQHSNLLPANFNPSGIVPYFIVTQLPAGIAGLAVAAIFAAAQSTVSSSLNSIAACWTVDIKQRLFHNKDEHKLVNSSKIVILVIGSLSTLMCIYMVSSNQTALLDLFRTLLGMLGAPIAGIFILGIFTRRANAAGALTGLIATLFILIFIKFTGFDLYFNGIFAIGGTVGIGYLTSLFFASKKVTDKGLTIFGLKQIRIDLAAEIIPKVFLHKK